MGLRERIVRKMTGLIYSRRKHRCSISDEEIVRRLEKAVAAKKLYLQPSITLVQVSKEIAVNRTYLARALKSIDTNYKEYINTFRIQYAIKLLMEKPDYSNWEVAELSGFGTLKTMDVYLRKRVGVTSSNLRRRGISMKAVVTAVLLFITAMLPVSGVSAQSIKVKTNMMFDALTAVNAGVEILLPDDYSISFDAVFPDWCDRRNNKFALQIELFELEVRKYLFDDSASQLYAGLFGGYGKACIQINRNFGHRINDFISAGVSFGYIRRINEKWELEYGIGIGYVDIKYDRYRIENYNGKQYLASQDSWRYHLSMFPIPAKIGLTLSYEIGGAGYEQKN